MHRSPLRFKVKPPLGLNQVCVNVCNIGNMVVIGHKLFMSIWLKFFTPKLDGFTLKRQGVVRPLEPFFSAPSEDIP